MNIDTVCSIIRSLAFLETGDSARGVENLGVLVWQAEGLKRTPGHGYSREFNAACRKYLRLCQAHTGSEIARDTMLSYSNHGGQMTRDTFPTNAQWLEVLRHAQDQMQEIYEVALNEQRNRARQVTGFSASAFKAKTQVMDTLMGEGFTNGVGAWAAGNLKAPRSTKKGGSK